MLVIAYGVISFMVPHSYNSSIDNSTYRLNVSFPHRFWDNFHSDYSEDFIDGRSDNPCHGPCNFQKVFAIICLSRFLSSGANLICWYSAVPMVTGIMEVCFLLSFYLCHQLMQGLQGANLSGDLKVRRCCLSFAAHTDCICRILPRAFPKVHNRSHAMHWLINLL